MGASTSKVDSSAVALRVDRELRAEYERLQVERQREMQRKMREMQEQHDKERLYGACGAVLLFGFCGLGAAHAFRLTRIVQKERAAVAAAHGRLKAMSSELESVRDRARRDVDSAQRFGISSFAKALLDVADNLGRAVDAAGGSDPDAISGKACEKDPATQLETLREGVRMTEEQLQASFGQHKIVRFGEVGDAFDPHLHDALFEVSPDAAPAGLSPGSIALLLKPGYELDGRVIRPAQVGTVKLTPAALAGSDTEQDAVVLDVVDEMSAATVEAAAASGEGVESKVIAAHDNEEEQAEQTEQVEKQARRTADGGDGHDDKGAHKTSMNE